MPGKEAKIKITYDAKKTGTFKKTITVKSNTDSGSDILIISGEVLAGGTDEDGDGIMDTEKKTGDQ